jgi:dihydrolipoamide dehydrogenase
MGSERLDIVVVGAGPAGYVAALRAGQLGLRVALVERAALGGVCLNRGCIPTITMREAALHARAIREAAAFGLLSGELVVDYAAVLKRRERVVARLRAGVQNLLRKQGVQLITGHGRLVGPAALEVLSGEDQPSRLLEAQTLVLATGSRPLDLEFPGSDHPRVIDSDGALSLADLPPRLLVLGGGAIGSEWSMNLARLGSRVTVAEIQPQLLPLEEPEVSHALAESMRREGIDVRAGTTAAAVEQTREGGLHVEFTGDSQPPVEVDYVLVAAGRLPLTDGLGSEELGLEQDALGFLSVDEDYRTNIPSILAVGDLTGEALRSHVAMRQGTLAVERLAGLRPRPLHKERIPVITFTDPEVAHVGLGEAEARGRGMDVVTGLFPYAAAGRGVVMGAESGLTKVVAESATGRLVGLHVIGPHAGELVGQGVLALEMGSTLEDLASLTRSHPTLWETIGEAAQVALGRPLHLPLPRSRAGRPAKPRRP